MAIEGYAAFVAHGAQHTIARHSVDDVGGGKVRHNAQSASHHRISYDNAFAVGGEIDFGFRLLWSDEPVERRAP